MAKKELKNRIAIILDRSSSMDTIRTEAVKMFNEQVKAIKKGAKTIEDTTVSLFTFSTNADEPIIFNRPAKELKELKVEEYIPNGWTAMYDSVGMAIERLSALPEMSDPDCSFLAIIVTDGEENKSQNFNGQRLSDQIRLLQAGGRWTFTFCGANVDVEKMAAQLHIPKGNTMMFAANSAGMLNATVSSAVGTKGFFRSRAGGQSAVQSFYDDSQNTAPVTTTTTVTTTTPPKATKKSGNA